MMRAKWIALLAAGVVQLSSGCMSTSVGSDGCPAVASVKIIPVKKGSGYDAAYEKLILDDACEPTLIRALRDVRKMTDPRQAPIDDRFVVSDAAAFIFLRRRNLDVETILPDNVSSQLPTRGIYAYFDFVATPAGRKFVTARVERLAKN